MISDGLTAKQAEGVGAEVEVVDVAQMLLAAVKRNVATPRPPRHPGRGSRVSRRARYAVRSPRSPPPGPPP